MIYRAAIRFSRITNFENFVKLSRKKKYIYSKLSINSLNFFPCKTFISYWLKLRSVWHINKLKNYWKTYQKSMILPIFLAFFNDIFPFDKFCTIIEKKWGFTLVLGKKDNYQVKFILSSPVAALDLGGCFDLFSLKGGY